MGTPSTRMETGSSNWKRYAIAITCICFLAGLVVSSLNESPTDLDGTQSLLGKTFHSSRANLPNDKEYLAGEADFKKRFKALRTKTDQYLWNMTLTSWKNEQEKRGCRKRHRKGFPGQELE